MKYLRLPDLGEGLHEAEIVQWHVAPGDTVTVDQLLVSVETAKAIVDIPSPQHGTIAALFGHPGDLLHTGQPLVEYANEEEEDQGTVVGSIQRNDNQVQQDEFIIGAISAPPAGHAMATPATRDLARRLEVNLDDLKGSGKHGMITSADVERAAQLSQRFGPSTPLRSTSRTMARNMARAHAEVASVSLFEDADLHRWPTDTDVTLRLISAIAVACAAVPETNSWLDGDSLTLRRLRQIDLGIAVDTADGLFVPVLRDIGGRKADDLQAGLTRLKQDVRNRTIPPSELQSATITLSNFGTLCGRYATPMVMPPTVVIIGAGVIRQQVVPWQGEIMIHPVLPLSITFDHRALTGGQAARFLQALIRHLQEE